MIVGIGVDICQIDKITKAMENPRFSLRVFTEGERNHIHDRVAMGKHSAAAIFAAKEATVKALGCGFDGVGFLDVEVTHNELGKPILLLWGNAKEKMNELDATSTHLSLSHDGNNAIAMVILEGT